MFRPFLDPTTLSADVSISYTHLKHDVSNSSFNGLMVNEYQILYSHHHNPHYNLYQIQNRGFNAKSLEEFAYLPHNMLVILITLSKNESEWLILSTFQFYFPGLYCSTPSKRGLQKYKLRA